MSREAGTSEKMELAELAQKFRNNASAVLTGDQVADEILNWAADFTIVRASSPAQEPVTTEPVVLMARPKKAIEYLTNHQVQCDADGVMIMVSRQALDEILAYLTIPVTTEPVAWQNIDRIICALETAGCCRNDYVHAPEDVVAHALRDWLRAIPAPPQLGRDEIAQIIEARVLGGAAWEEPQASCYRAADAILALTGEPK